MKKLLLVLPVLAVGVLVLGFSLKPFKAEAECRTFPGVLMKGKSNNNVKLVQEYLISAGTLATGNNSGYFGVLTEAAVKTQYKKFGLAIYNTVSQTLWEKMFPCGVGQSPAPSSAPATDGWVKSGSNLYFSGGNVGVGTNNPNSELHIKASQLYSGNADLELESYDGKTKWTVSSTTDKRFSVYDKTNNSFPFFIESGAGNNSLYVAKNSSVGIGTTNPTVKLQVQGSGAINGYMLISSDINSNVLSLGGDYPYLESINASLYLNHKNNQDVNVRNGAMIIKNTTGNVGIGTINPTEKLEVNGYIKSKGNITGDIVFQKNGETLWTMFEEEDGLMIKSAKTDKTYKLLMEEVK